MLFRKWFEDYPNKIRLRKRRSGKRETNDHQSCDRSKFNFMNESCVAVVLSLLLLSAFLN